MVRRIIAKVILGSSYLVRRLSEIYRKNGFFLLLQSGWVFFVRRLFRLISVVIPPIGVTLIYELLQYTSKNRSDANPTKLIYVSPDSIEKYYNISPKKFGKVEQGNWDQNGEPIEEHPVFRAIDSRFNQNKKWEETELYQRYESRIEAGRAYRRCRTKSELEDYFDEIEELYEKIAENGYQTQRELFKKNRVDAVRSNTDANHPVLNEIAVNIHRDGELVKQGSGNHRLAIAKALDLKKIPVVVRVRHAEWQRIRDDFRNADGYSDLDEEARSHIGHPDLDEFGFEGSV